MGSSTSRAGVLLAWNRKAHYYLGLFLLLFLWLFSLTGLLLNHPQWKFAEFWPQRVRWSESRAVAAPPRGTDVDQARDLMRQMGLRGEIEWTKTSADPGRLAFRVQRPGSMFEVDADLRAGVAKVEGTKLNGWGTARLLHSFTGERSTDKVNRRDWVLTTVWVAIMDATAGGAVLIVLSGIWMWWAQGRRRRWGLAALGLGAAACGYFVFGLRWLS